MDGPGLAWRPFCLVGFASSRNGVSKRETLQTGRWWNGRKVCTVWDKVRGSQMLCRREGCFGRNPQGGRRWRSTREMPGSKGSVDVLVEEAPAASEYTKLGGCVGLLVEPCHCELRVSLGPFWGNSGDSILHLAGLTGTGVTRSEDRPKYKEVPLLT